MFELLSNSNSVLETVAFVKQSKDCPFLQSANEVAERLCFYTCLSFCSQGGASMAGVCMAGDTCVARGACMVGDVHGRGRGMHGQRLHAWWGHVYWGGVHGRGVCQAGEACMAGVVWQGASMARGHVWQGHAWQVIRPLQRTVRILLECILV